MKTALRASIALGLTQAICSIAAITCLGSTNNLENAILAFPDITAWKYRPDDAVGSVNALIAAGGDVACVALERTGNAEGELTKRNEVNGKVCQLCRLVFEPTNSASPLRPPPAWHFTKHSVQF